jgi:hypothetical protein
MKTKRVVDESLSIRPFLIRAAVSLGFDKFVGATITATSVLSRKSATGRGGYCPR